MERAVVAPQPQPTPTSAALELATLWRPVPVGSEPSARCISWTGLRELGISAFKKVNITERQNLEIRGELFNAFNHTQFDSTNSSGIGSIGSANFGIIRHARSTIIQFTARYTF
jgi:hypothetical protein